MRKKNETLLYFSDIHTTPLRLRNIEKLAEIAKQYDAIKKGGVLGS